MSEYIEINTKSLKNRITIAESDPTIGMINPMSSNVSN